EFCAQEEKIAALFREDGSLPLDLENGPVVHLTLVTQTPCRHVLLLCLPALTADLGSIQCLVEDISRFYGESLTDGAVPDPLQYADFSEWQNELVEADDDSAEAARDQWRQQGLASLPALSLPFEARVEEAAGLQSESITVSIDGDQLAKIEMVASKHGTSAAGFALACW